MLIAQGVWFILGKNFEKPCVMLTDSCNQTIMQVSAKSVALVAQWYDRRLQCFRLQALLQWFNFYDFWRIET